MNHKTARRLAPALLLAAGTAALAQDAQFWAVDNPLGGVTRTPEGCVVTGNLGVKEALVSEDGSTVAGVGFLPGEFAGAAPRFAWTWTPAGGSVEATPFLDSTNNVNGISRDGSVLYGSEWRATPAGYEDLRSRLLDPVLGIQSGWIVDVSGDGQTVLYATGFIFPVFEVDLQLWQIDSALPATLPRAAGFDDGYFAFASVSDDGTVVGGATRRIDRSTTGLTTYSAVVIDDAGPVLLTPESSSAGVNDVNALGDVAVGYWRDVDASVRSFRWTRGGETVYFDAPGGSSSSARAVSADGSVVVGEFVVFGEPGTVAYIWTADTGARPLGEVLVDEFGLGAALAGWKLQTASDISGDGRVIAGTGVNPDGCLQTYVVRLPGGCEADITGNGELNIFDFLAFQNLFDDGDVRADFDGDGALTIFDFLAFQTAFDAGCE